jgi:hypothetical protein
MRFAVAVMLLTIGGCAPPAPEEREGDGGEGEGDVDADAFYGRACSVDADCDGDTRCTTFFGDDDPLVLNNCSLACIDDADCAASGVDSVCAGGFCLARCESTIECDALVGGGPCTDLGGGTLACLKARGARCERAADCADEDDTCARFAFGDIGFFCTDNTAVGQDAGARCNVTAHAFSGAPCNSQDDCPGGSGCASNGVDPPRCVVLVEEFCASDCFEGFCGGPCVVDDDCPDDFVCSVVPFTLGDGRTQRVGLCEPLAGSRTPCEREADCAPSEHCGLVARDDGFVERACRAADGNDVEIGAACGDDPGTIDVIEDVGDGCVTNFCNGRCRALCIDDSDCDGTACINFVFGFGTTDEVIIGACNDEAPCTVDADCGVDAECHAIELAREVRSVCFPRTTERLDSGEPCDPAVEDVASRGACIDVDDPACGVDQECNVGTRSCVRLAGRCEDDSCGGDHRCPQQCVNDNDCADYGERGAARCEGRVLAAGPAGEEVTTVVGFCVERVGAAGACGSSGDCAPESPVCTAAAGLDGAVGGLCVAVDDGSVQGRLADFAVCVDGDHLGCASGACIGGQCRPLCDGADDCVSGSCTFVDDALAVGVGVSTCAP